MTARDGPTRDKPLLKITAAKGLLSCAITNRENTPIRDCELYVKTLKECGGAWRVQRSSHPKFEWRSFAAPGQEMPGHLGRDRGVYVSCLVTVGPASDRSLQVEVRWLGGMNEESSEAAPGGEVDFTPCREGCPDDRC